MMIVFILLLGVFLFFAVKKELRQQDYDRKYIDTVVAGLRSNPDFREVFKHNEEIVERARHMFIEEIKNNMGEDSHDFTLAPRVFSELKIAVQTDLANERLKP